MCGRRVELGGERYAALVALAHHNARRSLVQPDAEPLQLLLNDALVDGRFGGVEHDQNEVAGTCHGDDLTAAAASLLGALDDTRQVDQLNLGAAVIDIGGYGGERGKLVRGHFAFGLGELAEQGRFAHGRETDHAYARIARLAHVESLAAAAAAARSRARRLQQQLTFQFRHARLESADVAHSGFVHLRPLKLVFDVLELLQRRHLGKRREDWRWRVAVRRCLRVD
eukprot:ctg_769.g371